MSLFPKIKPSSRRFTMGDYPSKFYRTLSGAVFRRSFGNHATDYKLTLEFKNIGDETEIRAGSGTVKAILDHYNGEDGTFQSFKLPFLAFNGFGTEADSTDHVRNRIRNPANIRWRYAEPPSVVQVIDQISTVTVNLVGVIEV